MDCQGRALAQHQRAEDVPAILVLENARLRTSRGLAPLLRAMDPLVPARAAGFSEYSNLEQRVRNGHRRGGGRGRLDARLGDQPETKHGGGQGSQEDPVIKNSCYDNHAITSPTRDPGVLYQRREDFNSTM